MKTEFLIMLAIILSGCGPEDTAHQSVGATQPVAETIAAQAPDGLLNPVNGSLGTLRVGMSKADLSTLGVPIKWGTMEQEGDSYQVATVDLSENIVIDCILSDGLVQRCSSASPKLRDRTGKGVGSTLRELRGAYPTGRLLVGSEDGRYANFVADGKLMFSMDMSLIKESCFELEACALDEDALRAVLVVMNNI